MATLVTFPFTAPDGTVLTAYTFEGHSWVRTLGAGIVTIIGDKVVDAQLGAASTHMLSTLLDDPDCTVQTDVINPGADFSLWGTFQLRARGNLIDHACYAAQVTTAPPSIPGVFLVRLLRVSAAGVGTAIAGAEVNTGISTHVGMSVGIRCTGSLIELLVNGAVVQSAVDATLAGAGYVGFFTDCQPTSLPKRIDNFSVDVPDSVPTVCFPDTTTALADPDAVALTCTDSPTAGVATVLSDPDDMVLDDSCIPEAV